MKNRFLPFATKEGIDGSGFTGYGFTGYAFCNSKGEIFIEPSHYGFWSFHPDSLKISPNQLPFAITNLQIANKTIVPGASDSILNQNINFKKNIKLDFSQNNFSFHYAAVETFKPEFVKYAYQLVGVDKKLAIC